MSPQLQGSCEDPFTERVARVQFAGRDLMVVGRTPDWEPKHPRVSGGTQEPLVLWAILDGKPGHDHQTLGLVDALERLLPEVICTQFTLPNRLACRFLGARFEPAAGRSPHLILGAGHLTHATLLRARRRNGGKAVVLMKPSLPLSLFDLAIIPDAYGYAPDHRRVLTTQTVLNRIVPSATRDPRQGMILIGGPAADVRWEPGTILDQIAAIVAETPRMRWLACGSRRTPQGLVTAFRQRFPDLPWHDPQTLSGLPFAEALRNCGTVWVTSDSMSMMYEAVATGAQVGILQLPRDPRARTSRLLQQLLDRRAVTSFSSWRTAHAFHEPSRLHEVPESDRAARELLARLLPAFLPSSSPAAVS